MYGCVCVCMCDFFPLFVDDVVKVAVERKWCAWKNVLGVKDEAANEKCMEVYKEEKRKVKGCIYKRKKEVNERFGRNIKQDVSGS